MVRTFGWVLGFSLLAAAPAAASAPLKMTDTTMAVPETFRVLQAFQDTISTVSKELIPSVVYIEAVQEANNRKRKVSGSGFVVSADGLIITNQHVVDRAKKVEVTLVNDRRRYPATIVGADQQTDIAVLRIDPPSPLTVPRFGDYAAVQVGEGVLAIGNPYGLDGTVSFGIVSAKGRNLNVGTLLNDFIQTDAMIDHGSSGGPLVNMRGEIIGVNSMGQGRGIGFTIPINTALDVKDRLVETGELRRGWLGVTIQALDRDLAEHLGFPDLSGVLITHIIDGSPAQTGGLQVEDIITEIDGVPIDAEDNKDLNNFRRAVAAVEPGSKVRFTYQRNGRERKRTVTITEQPTLEGREVSTNFGFSVKEITTSMQMANRLTSREGAFVSFVEKDSVGAEAGLRVGAVIVELNGKSIRSVEDFESAVGELKVGERFLIKARAGESLRYHLLIPYGSMLSEAEE